MKRGYVMAYPAEKIDYSYKYSDYLSWSDDVRCELIDGRVYDMSPAPTPRHQEVLGQVFNFFLNYLKGKPCKVFVAPFDVRIPKGNQRDEDIDIVVQPDITVVCDRDKLDEKGYRGVPSLVVEVVSQSTLKKDIKDKLLLYERVGVKEYWIVYPNEKAISVFTLKENNQYSRPDMYCEGDNVRVGIFEDLEINVIEIFNV